MLGAKAFLAMRLTEAHETVSMKGELRWAENTRSKCFCQKIGEQTQDNCRGGPLWPPVVENSRIYFGTGGH